MNILAILLFVFSSSFDIFTVSIAYGLKNIKINLSSNLVIAIISSLGTFLSMELGTALTSILPEKSAAIIGGVILLILGIYFIYDYYKELKVNKSIKICEYAKSPICILDKPEIADIDKSGTIEFKESFMLSIALALNNIGLGIGASVAGLNIVLTTLITFIFSIIIIPLGLYCSRKLLNNKLGEKGSLISGILLIILAIMTILY